MKAVKYYFNALMENVTVFGSVFTHLLLLAVAFALSDPIFYVLARGLVLIYLVTVPVKLLLFRNRPEKMRYKALWEKVEAASFPSVHAARAVFVFLAVAERFGNIPFTALLMAVAALVMYSRIYMKKHYAIDVVGGALLGAVIYFLASV